MSQPTGIASYFLDFCSDLLCLCIPFVYNRNCVKGSPLINCDNLEPWVHIPSYWNLSSNLELCVNFQVQKQLNCIQIGSIWDSGN